MGQQCNEWGGLHHPQSDFTQLKQNKIALLEPHLRTGRVLLMRRRGGGGVMSGTGGGRLHPPTERLACSARGRRVMVQGAAGGGAASRAKEDLDLPSLCY